ncbi:hypothetical protein AALP_AA8G209600 [Arabis alpina]|uniref:Uncharacterized protein n=1 Tax=Arabis alpina TaxID=50452 RepID=A0A087G8E4_ARAAL|nr:hypothetical protein AALP_AA8G209600 [Arabis alpina]
MPIIPLGDLGSCNDGSGEWDDEDRDKNVMYMEGLIRGGHTFKKEEWPSGFAGLDVVDVDEKSVVVEHERHVVDRKATAEEVDESGKRVGKRKGRKLRSSRSKRKQQKIDNYFPPVVRSGRKIKEWLAEQIAEVKTTFTAKIEQQAEELACLKKQTSCRRRRPSVGMVGRSVGRSGRFIRHCKTGRGKRDSDVGFGVGKGLIGCPSGETKGDSSGIGEYVTNKVEENGFVGNKCDSSNGCADWSKEKEKDNETGESAAAEEVGGDDIMDVADPPGVCAQPDDVSRGHNMDLGSTHSSCDVAEHTPSDLVEDKLHSKGDSTDVVSDQESVDEARELEEVRLAVNVTVMGTIAVYSDKQEEKVISAHGCVALEEDGTPTVEMSDSVLAQDVQCSAPSKRELKLARVFKKKPRKAVMDLLSCVDVDEFEEFKATLEDSADI